MKRTTLAALAAFAGLLVVVLMTREDKVNVGVPKLSLAPLNGEVTAVELSGTPPVRLTYESGVWKVNGFSADEPSVKGFTDALKDFRAADFVTDKTERHAELEVDEAKGAKMTVTTTGGSGWSLVFGKPAKAGGTYVREAKSNQVFTTPSPVAYQVKKKATDWRKKAIVTAQLGEVVKATVTRRAGVLTLLSKDNAWTMEPAPPQGFRFDAEAPKRLVQAATSLQAQDFGDALGEQVATVELELKDGKKVGLKLGAKRPEGTVPLLVDGDSQVYLLADWTAQQLLKGQDDMRDTTLLADFDTEKVKRLSITAAGKTTALAKEAAGWKVVEPKTPPADFKLDPQSVGMTLSRLKGLKATQVAMGVSDAAAGLVKPSTVIELQLESGAKQLLRFGGETPAKDGVYVKGTADGLTYSLPQGHKSSFEQGLEAFKERPPPDMSQIRGLEQLPPEVRRQLEAQLRQRNN